MSRETMVLVLHLAAVGISAGLKAVVEELEKPQVTRPRPRQRVASRSE